MSSDDFYGGFLLKLDMVGRSKADPAGNTMTGERSLSSNSSSPILC